MADKQRKRQRTSWQYKMFSNDGSGAYIAVGWIHNPKERPYRDVVRLKVKSSDGNKSDYRMTPLEAMSIAAGMMLTVQHRGWTGELQALGLHFEPGVKPSDD